MNIKLILYGIAVAAILGAGLYIRHMHKEAARVPALVQTINDLHKQRNDERERAQKALEQEADIRKRLASSDARAARLADRLRARLSVVPDSSSPPSSSPGTPGDGERNSEADAGSGGIIGAINDTLAACQRDAIRLGEFQSWYGSIPKDLRPFDGFIEVQ